MREAIRDRVRRAPRGDAQRGPGMYEYEIEALIASPSAGAAPTGPATRPIVASGANATVLHYTTMTPLGDHELLLIDAGASARLLRRRDAHHPEPARATSRAARPSTMPCGAQLAAIARSAQARRSMAVHKTGASASWPRRSSRTAYSRHVDEVLEKETYKRFYMHRTSHWLGRDVHDVGRYAEDGTPRALEPVWC